MFCGGILNEKMPISGAILKGSGICKLCHMCIHAYTQSKAHHAHIHSHTHSKTKRKKKSNHI